MNHSKWLGILFFGAILAGCINQTEPPHEEIGEPELVHSGKDLVLTPFLVTMESLKVKYAKPGEWKIAITKGPPGTSYRDGVVYYSISEGLEGPQEVGAIASDSSGRVLRANWSVTALPNRNHPPVITFGPKPGWIVVGRPFRMIVSITDPEGDSLIFFNRLPAGAVYRDSILEWTPTAAQVGNNQCLFHIRDARGNEVANTVTLEVRRYDYSPYAVDLAVGRTWWIKGYTKETRGTMSDSLALRRQVKVTAHNPETGEFSFRMIDTLASFRMMDTLASDTVVYRDTVLMGISLDGVGFHASESYVGMLPFQWAQEAQFTETATFMIGDETFESMLQTNPNTCLQGSYKFHCGGSEYVYILGMGRVSEEREGMSYTSYWWQYKTSYRVWAVAGF